MTLIDVDLTRDEGRITFTVRSSRGIAANSMCRPVKIQDQWFIKTFSPGENPPGKDWGVEFMIHHNAILGDSINLEADSIETMVSIVHKLGLV